MVRFAVETLRKVLVERMDQVPQFCTQLGSGAESRQRALSESAALSRCFCRKLSLRHCLALRLDWSHKTRGGKR